MNYKKILLVFGTRPEAIKMAPLIKALESQKNIFEYQVCVTGQHRKMLDQVLDLFQIIPDYDLDIMKKGQDLYDITSRVLLGMREVLKESKPDIVLVHGDTTTSLAAALAAFYSQIPVAHVESGLRTNNINSPWPEELNRQLTSRISSLNFAPTNLNYNNLINEGIDSSKIFITGNTIIDSMILVLNKINNDIKITTEIFNELANQGIKRDIIDTWSNKKRRLVLITGHRRENFGDGFINIFEAIKILSTKYPDVDFLYPLHLNPNVRKPISEVFGEQQLEGNLYPNIFFIEPLGYLSFMFILNLSYLILTDSGGIQEEAPGLGKPVVVMRDTTERPEAVDAGTTVLVGTDKSKIVFKISQLLDNKTEYEIMSNSTNPFGDGTSSLKIIKQLKKYFE